jgi:hypothetical protein
MAISMDGMQDALLRVATAKKNGPSCDATVFEKLHPYLRHMIAMHTISKIVVTAPKAMMNCTMTLKGSKPVLAIWSAASENEATGSACALKVSLVGYILSTC